MASSNAFSAGFIFLKESDPENDDPRQFLDRRMGGEQNHGKIWPEDAMEHHDELYELTDEAMASGQAETIEEARAIAEEEAMTDKPLMPTYLGGECPCPSIDDMDYCTRCGFKWSPREDEHGTPISGENMPPDSEWSDLDFTTSYDNPFAQAWDTIAKDFFFGSPPSESGRRMMAGAIGGDSLGRFIPMAPNYDLRTKAGRAASRTEVPRWRYGEDGQPEQYMEQLPKRELLPQNKTGYFGVDLSSPMWDWLYGSYGRKLDESNKLEEGVEATLHHEAMHAAVNDELMSHYQEAVNQMASDEFGLGGDDRANPEQREALQGFIDDNFFRAHEYAAHLGQETGLNNPNTVFGRRREGLGNRVSRRNEDAWADYIQHAGTQLSPQSLSMAEEAYIARMGGIPFPPTLEEVSDHYAFADKRNGMPGEAQTYYVGTGPGMEDSYDWVDDYADLHDPDIMMTLPFPAGSDKANFRDYRMLSPRLNSWDRGRETQDQIAHVGSKMPSRKSIGQYDDHYGFIPDSRRAMGIRAIANAAKQMGKDFDIEQFMEDRGL